MFKNLVLFIIAIVFSSCISNKDIDIFSSKDPIVFKTTDYSKKIKVGDLLSVNINSSTPKEYNLFNSQIVSTTRKLITIIF